LRLIFSNPQRFLVAFILLSLSLRLASTPTLASEDQPTALVRIDIPSESELVFFASLKIPIYAQLWDDNGGMFLLTSLDSDQIDQLVGIGFKTRLLDLDSRNGLYYLVYTVPTGAQFQEDERLVVLEESDRYRIIRVAQDDIELISGLKFEVQLLKRYPLVLPSQDTISKIRTAITPDPMVQAMIDQVDSSTAYDYVGDLSGAWGIIVNGNPYTLYSRYSYDAIPIKKATRFVYEHFENLGLAVDYDDYDLGDVPLRHVIAEQPGVTDPDCIVLLVGHLDSTIWGASKTNLPPSAPGADDNASGSTGVMIAADVLHRYQFACTIRYILFTGEEQVVDYGYFGSKFYVEAVAASGENLIGVINLDMIGFNSDQYEIIELHTRSGNSGDLAIANLFKNVIQAYGINLTTQIIQDGLNWSDHYSFWQNGYSAILAMEDWDDFTPNYHTTNDQLSTLDCAYLADFIRAAIGSVAHLAGPLLPERVYLPLISR
jgi:hypothetical protein